MGSNLFAFIVVLGVLIFFHELGHFLVARFFGVGVEKFSLGFGPRLIGKTVGRTDYRLSLIPLGGYVKMVGEEPDTEIDPALVPISFTHKNVYQRFAIVAAGPLFNLLLAVLIFFVVFMTTGISVLRPVVGEVDKASPAEGAGLRPKDVIVTIGGAAVESWEEMSERIKATGGQTFEIGFEREGQLRTVRITPELKTTQNLFGEDIERYLIGVRPLGDWLPRQLTFSESLTLSVTRTWEITELTVLSVIKLIQGKLPAETLGGPIKIAKMAGAQAREGLTALLVFIAVISINLAILNFLPIPVLDGGHLMFFTIEIVTRRPVSIKVREIAQQIGIFLLISLMIFVIFNDIANP
ncbi:MAG: RIP metalloprotease RseP [Desulfobacterales bacterium]|nr:RIP metalloprotease RseP [Desulfobacterales bacterium]MDJ0874993.1 RIP metalloprotease RseP [Desulfobacterales bacterium]MDJ0883442.1 RIP metalloprotease RseP [Desulfobacterales bacterium]